MISGQMPPLLFDLFNNFYLIIFKKDLVILCLRVAGDSFPLAKKYRNNDPQ